MNSQKLDYTQIYNDIKEFKEFIYLNNFKMPYLIKHVGISGYALRSIMEINNIDDIISENAHKLNKILPALKKFMETEISYSEYQKINKNNFFSLYTELKTEFPDIRQGDLISSAEKEITRINKAYLAKNEFIFNDAACYAAMIENRIEALTDEVSEYDFLLAMGHCYYTGEYDENDEPIEEYVALSDEERKEYKKISGKLWREIKFLEKKKNELKRITGFTDRIERNSKGLHRKNLQEKKSYEFSSDQQKAILLVYLSHCLDKRGYILPDHFKSGITLINRKVGGTTESKKWATEENIKKLGDNKGLQHFPADSPVYQFICSHKNVFFNSIVCRYPRGWNIREYSKYPIKKVMKRLFAAPSDVRQQIFDFLKSDFRFSVPRTAKEREKFKIISEYLDILSMKLPVADASRYSNLHIYRVAYEICAESDGKYIFSNELIDDIVWELKFKPVHWLVMMYIQAYYYKHKELKSLMKFIEKAEQDILHEKDLEI